LRSFRAGSLRVFIEKTLPDPLCILETLPDPLTGLQTTTITFFIVKYATAVFVNRSKDAKYFRSSNFNILPSL